MARRTAADTGLTGRCRTAQDAVRAHPAQHLHGQILQQEGQAGHVISRVHHDQDLRVAVLPLPGLNQPLDQLTHLPGGDRGGVVAWCQTQGVQWGGPGTAAGLQRADH
ncbi:hypothetical protein GCM10020256_66230 [Streptomyces thermocoprophilus]